MKRIALGKDEALLHLAIDPAFHGELDTILLHPALLDFATAGAQMLIRDHVAARDFFAPFSYRRVVLHAPLPHTIVSHIRYRSQGETSGLIAVFDVTIADVTGAVVAEISDFTMMRIRDASVLSHPVDRTPASNDVAVSMANERLEGILPEEGLRVIDQLLDGPSRPHTIISAYDLAPVLARLRAPRRAARRITASEGADGDDELPATATEQVIADLWSELLGVAPVRRKDNFFDLGGHSLLAVQFTNRLRKKTGRTLPLAALLDMPTVAQLAHLIDPQEHRCGV